MTNRNVTHATFVIERAFAASPEHVFRAFADPAAKGRWFVGPDDWDSSDHEMDFRVGGREHVSGGPQGGPVHCFDSVYRDIVPNERIITTYEMHLDDVRISVSLATTELRQRGDGTLLVYTEQGVYLDGYDDAGSREHGTRELFEALAASLDREDARA